MDHSESCQNDSLRWALSHLDGRMHLPVGAADLPWGRATRCGLVLPPDIRVAWARCGLDGRLHLLTVRAVLDIATLGCALACCGSLILTPRLVLRGGGTACGAAWPPGAHDERQAP